MIDAHKQPQRLCKATIPSVESFEPAPAGEIQTGRLRILGMIDGISMSLPDGEGGSIAGPEIRRLLRCVSEARRRTGVASESRLKLEECPTLPVSGPALLPGCTRTHSWKAIGTLQDFGRLCQEVGNRFIGTCRTVAHAALKGCIWGRLVLKMHGICCFAHMPCYYAHEDIPPFPNPPSEAVSSVPAHRRLAPSRRATASAFTLSYDISCTHTLLLTRA